MLADFFTKPLQGSLFRKFRDVIVGYTHFNTLRTTAVAPSEERVGKGVQNKWREANDRRSTGITEKMTCVEALKSNDEKKVSWEEK